MEAAEKCIALQSKLVAEANDRSTKGPTFSEAANSYITWLDAKNRRRREVRGHYDFPHRMYARILAEIGDAFISELNAGVIADVSIRLMPDVSAETRRKHVIVPIRATINHFADRGRCSPIRVRAGTTGHKKLARTYVSREWLDKFISAANELGQQKVGVAALFMFMTGARRREVTVFEARHFDLEKRRAELPPEQMKNGEEGIYYLPGELVLALRDIMPAEGLVFGLPKVESIYAPWKAVCSRANIPYVPPHQAGRHSFGTNVGKRVGKDLDVVTAAKLGRWKDPTVFLNTYVHSADDMLKVADGVFDAPKKGLKIVSGGKE